MLYSDLNLFVRDETTVNYRTTPGGKLNKIKSITSKSPFLIYDLNSIKQSVLTIFSTPKGSRIFRPNFGCDIMKYLFKPMDAITAERIENEILEALITWEPRISISNLEVQPDIDNQQYYVLIEYDIPSLRKSDDLSFNLKAYT